MTCSCDQAPGRPAATNSSRAARVASISASSRASGGCAPLDGLETPQLGQWDNGGGFPAEVDHLISRLAAWLRTHWVAVRLGTHRGHRNGGQ